VNPIQAIAKKEFLEHARRGGMALTAGLFLVVALGSGLIASAAQDLARVDPTQVFLTLLHPATAFLVPIMAMVLAHATIAGEQEAGSLGLLLAQPVSRTEVIVGKFLGLLAVLSASIALGFGVAAAVASARGLKLDGPLFAKFTVGTLLFGGAYLALFLLFSASAKRRNAALGWAVGSFVFLGLVWDKVGAFGVYLQLRDSPNLAAPLPTWFQVFEFLSPSDAFGWLLHAIGGPTTALVEGIFSQAAQNTWLTNAAVLTVVLAAWCVVPVVAALRVMAEKDL
jgi:ABC-type transport system involved in multi-copper enzyme maturation permease subunit